jgi:DNA-binding LacI/PurR family transcriptional regulator
LQKAGRTAESEPETGQDIGIAGILLRPIHWTSKPKTSRQRRRYLAKLKMDDIAALAGVSKATVSRAIHSPHLVKSSTLEKVRKVIRDQNYVYDAVAADFSRKQTSVIGLLVPTLSSSILAQSTHGVHEEASRHGFSILIANSYYAAENEVKLIQLFQQRRVAGIILSGITGRHGQILPLIEELGIPTVVVWELLDEANVSFVGFNNYRGAYQAVQYLIRLGHRRIGLIVGPYSRIDRTRRRLEGYRAALEDSGIEYDPLLVSEKELVMLDGKEAMGRLLSMPDRPTAVFAASDVLAMGALAAAREKGFNVPDDVSVVGFDDIDFAAYTAPPLTTIRVPAYEMGARASKVLVELINDGGGVPRQYTLDTNLIIRDSCREHRRVLNRST